MTNILILAAGGVAGTLARYFLGGAVQQACGGQFPFGTLTVNLIGCFLMGCFAVWADQKLGVSGKLFLMTGFCGAFTTFSAFAFEADQLLRGGSLFKTLAYILVSVAAGFLLFRAGAWIAQRVA